jgi:hypothetical protein
MSTPSNESRYFAGTRANRLDRWTTTAHQGGHILWLRGPDGVAGQLRKIAPRYQDLAGVAPESGWTHALFSPEAYLTAEVQNALEVLADILTLQRCPKLDFGLALDWYKIPDSTIDSRSWLNTPNGELVHKGKYWYPNNRQEQSKVGMQLVQNMSGIFPRHSALDRATIVLDVPGHDSERLSFGSRLATTVANATGKTMVKVQGRSKFRPAAKNLSASERAKIFRDEFFIPDDIRGGRVVIIDDVYKSGTSMGAVAEAARDVGALTVVGFAAVRTLSS